MVEQYPGHRILRVPLPTDRNLKGHADDGQRQWIRLSDEHLATIEP